MDETVEAAKKKARETGKRVEIPERGTETTTLFANPDGKTLRVELSTEPVRVKKAGGKGFTPIDTTLIEADGVIKPKAAKGNLVLSAGRDKTLLKSQAADATAKITTPSVLPEPKLKGNTATYRSAYGKGRDLVVTATRTGFQQQITIADRPTGPVSFHVPVDLPKDMSFARNAAGRPTIVGEDGKTLTEVRPTLLRDAKAADPTAPLDAGKVGKAAVTLAEDGKTLLFTPDAAFLTDPATTYPVTMTAAVSDWYEGHTGQRWRDGNPMDTYINDSDLQDSWDNFYDPEIVVGKSYASIPKRWRGYLQFPNIPAEFADSEVENADLVLWNYQSNDCGAGGGSGITARRITSSWDETTLAWNSQPSVTNADADTEYGAYSEECNYAWDLIHSLDELVQAWIDGAPNYGIQLTAGSESEVRNWRRYTSEDAGGCMSEPLHSCQGQPHPPILTVDFEEKAEPVQEEILMLSPTPLTGAPELYEDAVAKSIYQPTQPESVRIDNALTQAIGTQREGDGYLVDTEKLDLDDGGDGSGDEDVTAPFLITVEPGNGAVNVPLDTPVKATFSEKVGDAKVVLKPVGGMEVAGSSALTDEQVLTFTPTEPLDPGVTYTATVSGATDDWENTMQPFSWSFSTVRKAAGRWKFDEGDGRTAVDSSGNDHDASLNDTAAWTPGKNGSAVSNTPTQAQVTASLEAVHRGKAVEVIDQTTATSITYAQPDGKMYTTEIAAGPVRTRQNGAWVPIDTTLTEQNGVLKPKAIASDVAVAISNGGSGAFVSMTAADGQSYTLRWPTALPKPTINENTATFTNASGKGADLVVTVLPTGFRHDVVLRERPTEPMEIRIGVQTGGLTLSEGKGGRLLLTRGKSKKLIASAPQPVMWDAGTKASRAKNRLTTGGSLKARHARVTTDVVSKDGRTELVLKPDHKFLTDPATTYPVRVDPTTTLPFNSDVEVNALMSSDWPADPTLWYLTAGRMYGDLSRVYLRFDTASLAGQTVTDAKLSLLNIDAQGCGTAVGPGIQVRRVTADWDENNLTWGNKPVATAEDAVTNLQALTADCDPAPMQWTITGIVQDWAVGAANHGLMLRHPNEANTADNYRVFTSAEETDLNQPPLLTITTSGPTSAPQVSDLAISPAQRADGTTTATSLTPQLAAIVSDVIGGNLSGEFEIEHDPAVTGQGTGQIWAGTSAAVTSGSPATITVPAGKLADGWKIRWRARATSGGASSTSAWSNWQTATVDVPNPAVGAFQVTPAQQVGGVTVTTSLTPALHTTVTDLAAQPLRAEIEVEHDPAAPEGQGTGQIWTGAVDNVASGTQASATVPDGKLTDGWKVRWRTRAINIATTLSSPWSDWQILIVDVPDPVSKPAVSALQVIPSEQVHGTAVIPTRTPRLLAQVNDPAGGALRAEIEVEHDPAAPEGQGAGRIWTGSADNIPAGTQASIAIPANTLADGWKVHWRARAVSATAASAWSDWQSFTVDLPKPTATGLTITPSKVVDGIMVSTRLTPTLQATLTHPTGQALRAEVEIEHDPAAPEGQGNGQIWTGSADNVVSSTQASLTVPTGELTDGWKVRWRLRAVTEQATSAWSDWQQVTIDVTQPGEEPLAQTAGPVIRTDQSFTAAAWLRWSDKDVNYTVLEQKGTHTAPFRLGNTADHGLVLTFTSADATDATVEGVLSDVEPPVNEWFHLAGVYDSVAKTASLYLNGTLVKTSPVSFTAWNADTAMTLGSKMQGDLDDVQLYQRPLSFEDLTAVFTEASVRSPIIQSAAEAALRVASPTTTTSSFNQDHLTLEDCYNTPVEPKYELLLARIQERPYASCWSSYVSYTVYESDGDDDDPDRRRRRAGNKSLKLANALGITVEQLEQELFPDIIFQMRVTWVVHTYLGNASGNGVVNGAGTNLTPQTIKLFARLGEFGLYSQGRRLSYGDDKLEKLKIGFNVELESQAGRPCRIQTGSEQVRTIESWRSNSDAAFVIDADTDALLQSSVCTIKPMWSNLFGYSVKEGRLWSQEYFNQKGKRIGVIRKGDGPATGNLYAPHVRCDWRTAGREGDPTNEVDDHTGGCVNTRGHKVFVMSKSQNANFLQVIEHIETALNRSTNARTHPAVRPNETQNPPLRTFSGTEQIKTIPGNWAANPTSISGGPLTKNSTDGAALNRQVFSGRNFTFTAEGNFYRGNYCRYYYENLYNDPAYIAKVDPRWNELQCDEYPFASSQQGAASIAFDYSLRAVGREHNRLQGIALGKFYSKYRVVDLGDPYWIMIVS